MDDEIKPAPLISFNNHFKFDHHDSDEELLMMNTPLKKLPDSEAVKEKPKMYEKQDICSKPDEDTNSSCIKTSGALIIGEMSISLDEPKLDDSGFQYSQSVIRAPIIPYLIMPFTKNSKSLKIKETLVEDKLTENQNEISHLDNTITKNNNESKMDTIQVENNSEASFDDSIQREKWSHKTEFLLAIIGFSVDLGNIWRCIYLN